MEVKVFQTMAQAVQALEARTCPVAVVETPAGPFSGDAHCDVLCLTQSARSMVVEKFMGLFRSMSDYPNDPRAPNSFPHLVVYREAQEIVEAFAV